MKDAVLGFVALILMSSIALAGVNANDFVVIESAASSAGWARLGVQGQNGADVIGCTGGWQAENFYRVTCEPFLQVNLINSREGYRGKVTVRYPNGKVSTLPCKSAHPHSVFPVNCH